MNIACIWIFPSSYIASSLLDCQLTAGTTMKECINNIQLCIFFIGKAEHSIQSNLQVLCQNCCVYVESKFAKFLVNIYGKVLTEYKVLYLLDSQPSLQSQPTKKPGSSGMWTSFCGTGTILYSILGG